MIISPEYLEKILSAFKFAKKQSFCQLATVAKQGDLYTPKLRTVLMYYDQEHCTFYFTCSTQTHKWSELETIPKVSGVYFDRDTITQYRFEANAVLTDKNSTDEKLFHEKTWRALRPDLRRVLWLEYLADETATYDIDTIFPHHGIVVLMPYYWDIFTLDTTDFSHSMRTQMLFKNDHWQIFANAPKICPLDLLVV